MHPKSDARDRTATKAVPIHRSGMTANPDGRSEPEHAHACMTMPRRGKHRALPPVSSIHSNDRGRCNPMYLEDPGLQRTCGQGRGPRCFPGFAAQVSHSQGDQACHSLAESSVCNGAVRWVARSSQPPAIAGTAGLPQRTKRRLLPSHAVRGACEGSRSMQAEPGIESHSRSPGRRTGPQIRSQYPHRPVRRIPGR